jgi:hypothetical protein
MSQNKDRLIMGPLLFPLHVKDLPKTIEDKTTPSLCSDYTSIVITYTAKHYSVTALF